MDYTVRLQPRFCWGACRMSDAPGQLPTGGGYAGAAWNFTPGSNFNALSFLVEQINAGNAFAAMVVVRSVTGGTATGKPPIVSVQPLVSQTDGLGNLTPHGTIYNIPCFRLQGANGAVVLDPGVEEVGLAVICDRDISNVKATGAVSGPGSWRMHDWADGCYFGGFLNDAQTTYVGFGAGTISLVTPTASVVVGNGGITMTGTLTNNGVNVGSTHYHDAPSGGGDTGPPL